MERPVLVMVTGDRPGDLESEIRSTGSCYYWQREAEVDFLQRRFPSHCPHHLIHNLLNLHYSRHEPCSAAPFTNDECRHGTHARPVLAPAQVRATAPAEGALILLPFGLSCRACDDQSAALVDGCAECELLEEGEVCGGCRRVWLGEHPQPAAQLPQVGLPLELEEWRLAVGLGEHLPSAGGTGEPEEEDYEEEQWGEEEWEDENGEEEDHEDDGWASAEEEEGDASWDADDDGVYDGKRGSRNARSGPAGAGSDGWGAGKWIRDRRGNWEWSVDFAASAAASAAPAAGATDRVRILELQLELERLKRQRLA